MNKKLRLIWLINLLVIGIMSSFAIPAAPVDVSVAYPTATKNYQTLQCFDLFSN